MQFFKYLQQKMGFEEYKRVIFEEPSLPSVFLTVQSRMTGCPRVLDFVSWNLDTLERCIADESIEELMAWEKTLRDFMAWNKHHEKSKLYTILMSRLDRLMCVHNIVTLENLKM